MNGTCGVEFRPAVRIQIKRPCAPLGRGRCGDMIPGVERSATPGGNPRPPNNTIPKPTIRPNGADEDGDPSQGTKFAQIMPSTAKKVLTHPAHLRS